MNVVIIAEAGVNHNGNLKTAKKLVDVAKWAGADYIKFQSFDYLKLVTKKASKANYQKLDKKKETQSQMLKRLQLSHKDQINIVKYCKKKKIKFLSTAFDIDNLKFLIKQNIELIKIPSGEITNLPLLKYISKLHKKILLSTGASSMKDIEKAFAIFKNKKKNITILQCNSAYPTPLKDLNLNVIKTYKKKFKCKTGLSDHSLSTLAPIAAVALGATVIEKHFTLNRGMSGPDHKSSLEPNELKEMIDRIKEIKIALGKEKKIVTKSEFSNRKIIRKSLVASKFIKKGDKFTINNITAKRPSGGISPMKIDRVLGKIAKKNFIKDNLIKI